jgi:hypothetical protein
MGRAVALRHRHKRGSARKLAADLDCFYEPAFTGLIFWISAMPKVGTTEDRADDVVERLRFSIESFYDRCPASREEPAVCSLNEHERCFAAIAICDLFGDDDDSFSVVVQSVLQAASRRLH